MSESAGNFILNDAKNLPARHPRWQAGVGDAIVSARLFKEVQDKIYRLQPFEAPVEQVYLSFVQYSSVSMALYHPLIPCSISFRSAVGTKRLSVCHIS
jgi:hypothetical protein